MGPTPITLVALIIGLVVGHGLGIRAAAAEVLPPPLVPAVLTLDKAIALALAHHPSLRVASGTQAINEAKVGQAQSSFFPQVQARSAYQQATANNATSFGGGPTTRNTRGDNFGTYQNSVTLTQLLYDFGKVSSQVTVAQANLQAAHADADTAAQTVIVNAQQAYFGLQQAHRLVSVGEEAMAQFTKHLDLANGRFKAGVAPKIDVTTAEVDLSNAHLNLITARNNAQVARVTLTNAMGINATDHYRVEDPTLVPHQPISLEDAMEAAMRLRPELIAQQASERAAESAIQAVQRDFLPTVSGSASYSYNGQDFPLVYNWNLMGAVTVPIFSGFLTTQQVAEARANLLRTKANGEVLRHTIQLDVHQALVNLEGARERLQVTAVTVVQAKERLALAEGRYRAGLSNAIEVTDAGVALVSAQVNDVVALSSYQAAKARLDRATGRSASAR